MNWTVRHLIPTARNVFTPSRLLSHNAGAPAWRRMTKRTFISDSSYTSVNEVVENTGSTARDHLANERTFLAWCRTGMSFLGAGIALFSSYELLDDKGVQKRVNDETAPLMSGGWKVIEPAALMILNSGVFLTYATYNYFRVQRCIARGFFPQNKIGLLGVVCTTGSSSLLALYLMASDRDVLVEKVRDVSPC